MQKPIIFAAAVAAIVAVCGYFLLKPHNLSELEQARSEIQQEKTK